jgi:hypothetical protein
MQIVHKIVPPLPVAATLILAFTAGCGQNLRPLPPPLPAANINFIFAVSPDLAFQAPGDVNPATANLTSQGFQRSLLMSTFLKQSVLGGANVTTIYALEPTTHLQTAAHYPDLAPLESIQQFALLNQVAVSDGVDAPVTAASYPLLSAYAAGSVPAGVAPPVFSCSTCQGLDFNNTNGDNDAILLGIIKANAPGFYVFSAPWETVSAIMSSLNAIGDYNLALPPNYGGPNQVYVVSVAPSAGARLVAYNPPLNPPATYPVLPVPAATSCNQQKSFSLEVTAGDAGAVLPAGINTSETIYFIRHAEAHPVSAWEDGNYVGAGQWRALSLPNALRGKIQRPSLVLSIDPSNAIPPGPGRVASAYVRTTLTAEPFAIANNLPHQVASSVAVFAQNAPQLSTNVSAWLFTGGQFSNQTILAAWEHEHIPPTINALLASYQSTQIAPNWPDADYDTVWTIHLDAHGNLTVDNQTCEGIDSAALPATPPQF